MQERNKNTENITEAIKSIDERMKKAVSPKEHEDLEQKMAELMEKLLHQIRPK
jgi:threonyl-tRNA synthetase